MTGAAHPPEQKGADVKPSRCNQSAVHCIKDNTPEVSQNGHPRVNLLNCHHWARINGWVRLVSVTPNLPSAYHGLFQDIAFFIRGLNA